MREQTNSQNVVYYLHGDHLGSTSLSTDSSGAEVTGSRTLYYPYGEERWSASGGTLTTDYGFTGQRRERGIGLYDYNARFYDPALGRFVSADTIVPSPGNPQSLNRYSYARNSPLNRIDPSGHQDEPPSGCTTPGSNGCYGPLPPPTSKQTRTERAREIENKVALAINATFLFVNGILGPLAGVASTPPAGTYISANYGGKYYPPGQVGMWGAVEDDGYYDGLDYGNASLPLEQPTGPLPSGASRLAQFGMNWREASLQETIGRIAGNNSIIEITGSGKTIYRNPDSGLQVVYDNAGNYFRVENPNATGVGQYLDLYGNEIPANVRLVGPNGVTQTGLPPDVRKALTHFKNTD
ncbi:MAG: RHS repeat-associated core domain-containing protein [Aestuariibacter sp.]|nr:RHS repeat-associated core domain-containing protein [Aestuariibacter sp.]